MSKTLLLADDSVTIQKVVGISFANEDLALLTVDNGDDAIRKVREARPDIVLADVVMPGKNGYEVCEAIKGDPQLRHIPVLLLTGTFEAFDEARAQRAGADGHVTKPFEAQALVDEVNALLARATSLPSVTATPRVEQAKSAPAAPLRHDDRTVVMSESFGEAGGSFEFFDEEAQGPPAGPAAAWDEEDTEPTASVGVYSFDGESDDLPLSAPFSAAAAPAYEPGHDETIVMSAPFAATLTAGPTGARPPRRFGVQEPVGDPARPAKPARGSRPQSPPAAPIELVDHAAAMHAFDDLPTLGSQDPLAQVGPDEMIAEAVLDPAGGRGYDVSSSDLGDPLGAAPARRGHSDATPAPAPFTSDPPWSPGPTHVAPPLPAPQGHATRPATTTAATVEGNAGRHGFEPTPQVRQEIREVIERVAREALGRVAEKLLEDAIESVEKVAWEVVPQLAETLVREEIRRLKGE